ncbi:hypothetical protein Vadar_029166 [Vaccinium darrowii]|uniref:Uncharacterized protein n=1 Tax=Vaccinium darrowii TaxID=229202 RepID=A0ACB7Y9J5_9ERIC|nr:hypothetical protein Vadar_029166 [Vaccinium darrowii]
MGQSSKYVLVRVRKFEEEPLGLVEQPNTFNGDASSSSSSSFTAVEVVLCLLDVLLKGGEYVTPQADNPVMYAKPVSNRIHPYALLFISQCFTQGSSDRLQVLSTDFIDEDFVDACVGLTRARIEGEA